jgi:hypothetical protein
MMTMMMIVITSVNNEILKTSDACQGVTLMLPVTHDFRIKPHVKKRQNVYFSQRLVFLTEYLLSLKV